MIDRENGWRLLFTATLLMLAMLGLGFRLAFLHVGPHERTRELYEEVTHIQRTINAPRGNIVDARGRLLALDHPTVDVCVDPKVICARGQVLAVSEVLSRALQLPRGVVQSRVDRPKRRFEYVKRFVSEEKAEEIRELALKGVFFRESTVRQYPQETLMCHVVGFSNLEGVGSAGIELIMNKLLKGRPGLLESEVDGRRNELYSLRKVDIAPEQGADIHLTLDQNIQYFTEKALDEVMEEYNAKGAWAIVQRVKTGEILAMAARPGFDLNDFRNAVDPQKMNSPIGYNYEPGSTMKAMVIAAAIDMGIVTPETMIDCENGAWLHEGRILHDSHPYGILSVSDILKKSSNIGIAKIAALYMKPEVLDSYLRDFGIARKHGAGLPGEESGYLLPVSKWPKIKASRVGIGQGVTVTALQMMNALCSIGNGGVLMKPYVVKKIVHNGETIVEGKPEVAGRPISAEAADITLKMLARVTEKGGTGRRACVRGYRVAGKTGTAQKTLKGRRGYSDTNYIGSFMGFLPAEDPEIAIIVVVDEPQPIHAGGRVAAPAFAEIARQTARYLDIPSPSYKFAGTQSGNGR